MLSEEEEEKLPTPHFLLAETRVRKRSRLSRLLKCDQQKKKKKSTERRTDQESNLKVG